MRASPVASTVPTSGHYYDKKRYQAHDPSDHVIAVAV